MDDDRKRPRLLDLIGLATRQTFAANSFVGDYVSYVSWDDDRYGRLAGALRPLLPAIAASRTGATPGIEVDREAEPVFSLLLEEFPSRITVEEIEAAYVAPIASMDVDLLDAIAAPSVAVNTLSGLFNKASKPVEEALARTKGFRDFVDRHGKTLLAMPMPEDILRRKAALARGLHDAPVPTAAVQ